MADSATVKANMQKMLSQGATPEEVEEYARLEGVTPEQVNSRSPLQQVGDFFTDADDSLTDLQTNIRKSVTGPEKGTRTDLEDFEVSEGENLKSKAGPMGPISSLAGMFSDDDEGYGAIIKEQLGDRYVGTEKDPNGYDIITYKGDDGKEYVAYVNKPGLDLTDVNRELGAAIPAAISGFAASRGVKGADLGPLGRILGVGTTEAATAAAKDVTGAHLGAPFKPLDTLIKAVVAGGAGGLFEGLSGPITNKLRKWFGSKGFIDPKTGALTPIGTKAVKGAGLDPADINARIVAELEKKAPGAADLTEVGADIRTGEFDIPSSRGQRTKRPDLLTEEEELRRGNMGEEAQTIMRGFDESQTSAIDRAVNDSVGMSLAPRQGGREPATLGTRIREGARDTKKVWDAEEDRLWGETGPMYPDPAYRQNSLYPILNRRLAGTGKLPTPTQTPAAHEMMTLLEDYANNRITKPPYESLQQEAEYSVDEMRRRLYGLMDGADPGSRDKTVAAEIYGAYDEWLEDLAKRGAMTGTPKEVAQLKLARGFSRDVKGLFAPRAGEKSTPAAAKIQAVVASPKVSSPTDLLTALIPSSPKAAAPKGTDQAFRHLKGILRAGGDVGEDTWNDIRLAYWAKLASDNKGKTLSPLQLKNNIDAVFHNQQSVVNILYSPEEQAVMRRLSAALGDVTYKPPNPSGTAHTITKIKDKKRRAGRGIVEDQIQLKQRSATFQGKSLERLLWRTLGKHMPTTAGVRDFGASKLAKGATSPRLTPKPGSALIAPAASIGALEFADDLNPLAGAGD